METRNTKSWQSNQYRGLWLIAIGGSVAMAGCGDPERLDLSPKPLFSSVEKVPTPNFGRSTTIVLRNEGETLHVGDPGQKALSLYAKPKKSYEFRDLPAQFGEGFRARGWESDLESYGVITFEDQLAVAVRTLLNVEEARIQEAIRNARYEVGKETQVVTASKSRYWFWEVGRHRKMICAMDTGNKEFSLTIAIGETSAMTGLRMSVQHAERDSRRADAAPVPSNMK